VLLSLLDVSANSYGLDVNLTEHLCDITSEENINMKDDTNGITLLHAAASLSERFTIKDILKKTANVMVRDKNGSLPLELAVKNGNSKLFF
jgi:ankyrin repeat protein